MRFFWTTKELKVLKDNRTLSSKAISELLPGRSPKAVAAKRHYSDLRKIWLAHELDILRNGQHTSTVDLVKLLPDRTYKTIERARHKFGWPRIKDPRSNDRPRGDKGRFLCQKNNQTSQHSTPD